MSILLRINDYGQRSLAHHETVRRGNILIDWSLHGLLFVYKRAPGQFGHSRTEPSTFTDTALAKQVRLFIVHHFLKKGWQDCYTPLSFSLSSIFFLLSILLEKWSYILRLLTFFSKSIFQQKTNKQKHLKKSPSESQTTVWIQIRLSSDSFAKDVIHQAFFVPSSCVVLLSSLENSNVEFEWILLVCLLGNWTFRPMRWWSISGSIGGGGGAGIRTPSLKNHKYIG